MIICCQVGKLLEDAWKKGGYCDGMAVFVWRIAKRKFHETCKQPRSIVPWSTVRKISRWDCMWV